MRWTRWCLDLGDLDPWALLPLTGPWDDPVLAWRDRRPDGWTLLAAGRSGPAPWPLPATVNRAPGGRPWDGPAPPLAWLGGGFHLDGPPTWGGWPAMEIVLPRWVVGRRAGRTVATVLDTGDGDPTGPVRDLLGDLRRAAAGRAPAAPAPAEPLPLAPGDPSSWARAIAALREPGAPAKVVLAREVFFPGAFDPAAALRALAATQPGCTAWMVRRGDRAFVGATPEDLLRWRGRTVRTMALAGTRPGRDQDAGRQLVAHPKDRQEHQLVVAAIREALGPCCDPLRVAEAPAVLRLADLQHLRTGIEGRLRPGADPLHLLRRLHPTPAVAGLPRRQALAWIARFEPFERGWYAGPLGWLDRDAGAIGLSLRSALVGPEGARAWAGCGLVPASQPDAEWAEATQKLLAVRRALAMARIGRPATGASGGDGRALVERLR